MDSGTAIVMSNGRGSRAIALMTSANDSIGVTSVLPTIIMIEPTGTRASAASESGRILSTFTLVTPFL